MTTPRARRLPAFLFLLSLATAGWSAPSASVTVQPRQVWIEAASNGLQALNFDFVLENPGAAKLGIDRIEVQAFDANGGLIAQRQVDGNGFSPAMLTLPNRELAGGAKVLVFNPFHEWPAGLQLHKLVYRFGLRAAGEPGETVATATVMPQAYVGRTVLRLPLSGPLLVHDGHDFLAHHRRMDTEHEVARQFRLTHNFMRYALDLNPTDAEGQPFKGEGARNDEWAAWEQPVLAPADGVVADAGDGDPDNERGQPNRFDPNVLLTAPMRFYGNYVVIDHGQGEFSLLGHLRQGSVKVKRGDRVQSGQAVAKVGSSGSSNNPHLHYELRNGATLAVDGLPAYFSNFDRLLGRQRAPVQRGSIDSGDRIEAR